MEYFHWLILKLNTARSKTLSSYLGADLVAALASLDVHNFPHDSKLCGEESLQQLCSLSRQEVNVQRDQNAAIQKVTGQVEGDAEANGTMMWERKNHAAYITTSSLLGKTGLVPCAYVKYIWIYPSHNGFRPWSPTICVGLATFFYGTTAKRPPRFSSYF